MAALIAVLAAGCVPAAGTPSAKPTTGGATLSATPTPTMTGLASPQPPGPVKAPPGTAPGPVAQGSLTPGEPVLAIERFDDPAIFGGPGRVSLRHAVSVGSGFVIVGDVWHVVGDTTGRAWLSPDGRSWERVDVPAMDRAFAVNDLAATPDGTLVANGIGSTADGFVVWSSPDGGRTWQKAKFTDIAGTMQLGWVVGGPRGFLMVGWNSTVPARDGDTALWWSPDGQRWTRAEMPRNVFGDVSVSGIAATASGFVAVGERWPAGVTSLRDATPLERGVAWLSADGLRWSEADVPDAAPPLVSVVVSGRAMLATAFRVTDTRVSWWRSDDGRVWEPDTASSQLWAPNDSPMDFGWRDSLYQLGTSWRSGGPVGELWASDDGRTWRRIGATLEPQLGGIGGFLPGEPGILMRDERNGAGSVRLICWPAP